jgi:hypothetical protein
VGTHGRTEQNRWNDLDLDQRTGSDLLAHPSRSTDVLVGSLLHGETSKSF